MAAINSAIVKLSKLTVASKVYRGVHDFVLPDQFWTPNEYAVRGGVEGGFTSTTLNREEAVKYAKAGRRAAVVFEIQQGMCDRVCRTTSNPQLRVSYQLTHLHT